MTARLTGVDFDQLFTEFEHTAFRMEARDRYDIPGERESVRRFLAGEPDEERRNRPWLATMRAVTGSGRRVERVRVVTEPLSDYTHFLLAGAGLNVDAGEDIRYLPRAEAGELPLGGDWWLFDSARLAVLHFDEHDQFHGAELVTDPDPVGRACQSRDALWPRAIAYIDYAARWSGP